MHSRAKGIGNYYWPWAVILLYFISSRAADPSKRIEGENFLSSVGQQRFLKGGEEGALWLVARGLGPGEGV